MTADKGVNAQTSGMGSPDAGSPYRGNHDRPTETTATSFNQLDEAKLKRVKPKLKKPRQTLLEKREARRDAGIAIAETLRKTAMKYRGFDRIELWALAERIEQCTARENWFIQPNTINFETGELYEAGGPLWQCGSKLCPNCVAIQSRKSRKKLNEAIAANPKRANERYYFFTLTQPNPGLSLRETRELMNRAWSLFRKRKLCVDAFRGGCKSEEFTLTANGYHYHLHLLILARWFDWKEFKRVWTECLETAWQEAKRSIAFDTYDGYAIVKPKVVHDLPGIVFEVAKYLTKSDSWQKLKSEDLAEVALIHRWNRMFECFGDFLPRNIREANDTPPLVHTKTFTDGKAVVLPTYWRDLVRRIGIDAYLVILRDEIKRTQTIRLEQVIGRAVHDSA